MDYIELVMMVEEEWDIEISDAEISAGSQNTKGGRWRDRVPEPGVFGEWRLRTVQDWVRFLMNRLGA